MTKQELRQHLLAAPPGTTPGGIVSALRAKGVVMEGDPVAPQRSLLEPVPLEQGPSVGGFAQNVAKSAGRLARDVGSAVIHPIETAKNVAKLGIGAGANAVETAAAPFVGMDRAENIFNAPGEQAARGVGEAFVKRYGEDFAKTLYEDPVGVMSDVATALYGAGAVAKLSKAGLLSKELTSLGVAADPIANSAKVVGKVANKGVEMVKDRLGASAEGLYQSALKPTKAVLNKNPNVVKTGLENRIRVSANGLDEVNTYIDDLNTAIAGKIKSADAKGVVIATDDVIQALDETKQFFGNAIGGSKFVDQINELADTFRKERGKTIPVGQAQATKQATYAVLRKAYGELRSAETEGSKALARGLKEQIAKNVSGISDLNLKESQLLGLEKALEDFVRRNNNHDILGLSGGVGVGAGAVAAGVGGAAAGGAIAAVIKRIFDNPAAKSQLAIFLNDLSKKGSLGKDISGAIGKYAETLRAGSLINDQEQ